MKGRSRKSGDYAEIVVRNTTLAPSMKGRSRKSGYLLGSFINRATVTIPSMKGRSRKSGDGGYRLAGGYRLGPSMKGRSRKSGDLRGHHAPHPQRTLNERPLPKERRLHPSHHHPGWSLAPQ